MVLNLCDFQLNFLDLLVVFEDFGEIL